MAQGILGILDQIGRGFERIYEEDIPTMQEVRGLLGMSPAQAAPVAEVGDMSTDPAAQGILGVPSPKRNPVRPDTLLKKFENEALVGFKNGQWFAHESLEGGRPTIGWGHKVNKNEDRTGKIKIGNQLVEFKNGLTPQQVNQLYKQDTANARAVARKSLEKGKGSYTDNELQALTSLIYNIGQGTWGKSNAKNNLEKGNISGFLKEAFDPKIGFVKVNKKISKGLVDRRAKERRLFQGIR
jgi:GH24 family phage-related lysozyme (muramidase)